MNFYCWVLGYTVYRLDRGARGGGVAIVAKSFLVTSLYMKYSIVEVISIRSHLPKWFTPPLHFSLNKVCSLQKLVIRRCYPSHLEAKLERLEGCLQQQIKDAKAAYELKLFANFAENKNSL